MSCRTWDIKLSSFSLFTLLLTVTLRRSMQHNQNMHIWIPVIKSFSMIYSLTIFGDPRVLVLAASWWVLLHLLVYQKTIANTGVIYICSDGYIYYGPKDFAAPPSFQPSLRYCCNFHCRGLTRCETLNTYRFSTSFSDSPTKFLWNCTIIELHNKCKFLQSLASSVVPISYLAQQFVIILYYLTFDREAINKKRSWLTAQNLTCKLWLVVFLSYGNITAF